jgi:hypothetical protein
MGRTGHDTSCALDRREEWPDAMAVTFGDEPILPAAVARSAGGG